MSAASASTRHVSGPAAYRRLLKSCYSACASSGLDADAMQHYVHRRFSQVAASPLRFDGSPAQQPKEKIRDALLISDCFHAAQGSSELSSIIQILSAGVGNEPLQRALERGFFDMVNHEAAKEARSEADEDSSSERQNQLMQQAMSPYAQRLLDLHDPLRAAAPPSRSTVSVHVVDHGAESLVLEIDDALNKQVFYVLSREAKIDPLEPMGDVDDAANEPTASHHDVHGEEVEVMSPETLRNTTIHAELYSIAQRLYESAIKETPMHRSRSSVVVGYGRGGAVGTAVALLLASQDYNVRNCISFGSPKALTHFMERSIFAITPIRVVIAGDARVEQPVSSAEGDPFVHVGEILILEKHSDTAKVEGAASSSADPNDDGEGAYSLAAYCELLQSQATKLTYAEGDDVWDEGPKKQMIKEWTEASQLHTVKSWEDSQRQPQ